MPLSVHRIFDLHAHHRTLSYTPLQERREDSDVSRSWAAYRHDRLNTFAYTVARETYRGASYGAVAGDTVRRVLGAGGPTDTPTQGITIDLLFDRTKPPPSHWCRAFHAAFVGVRHPGMVQKLLQAAAVMTGAVPWVAGALAGALVGCFRDSPQGERRPGQLASLWGDQALLWSTPVLSAIVQQLSYIVTAVSLAAQAAIIACCAIPFAAWGVVAGLINAAQIESRPAEPASPEPESEPLLAGQQASVTPSEPVTPQHPPEPQTASHTRPRRSTAQDDEITVAPCPGASSRRRTAGKRKRVQQENSNPCGRVFPGANGEPSFIAGSGRLLDASLPRLGRLPADAPGGLCLSAVEPSSPTALGSQPRRTLSELGRRRFA